MSVGCAASTIFCGGSANCAAANLVCFCAPLGCHGHLLLRLADGTREELIAWWRCDAV